MTTLHPNVQTQALIAEVASLLPTTEPNAAITDLVYILSTIAVPSATDLPYSRQETKKSYYHNGRHVLVTFFACPQWTWGGVEAHIVSCGLSYSFDGYTINAHSDAHLIEPTDMSHTFKVVSHVLLGRLLVRHFKQ